MEELIFFAVIIFFSILESISRSRRAKQKREQGGLEGLEDEQFEWAQTPPWETDLPRTYDEDPSYDETAVAADEYVATEPVDSEPEQKGPRSVVDILAELGGITTEETRKESTTISIPRQSPSLPEPRPPVVIAERDEASTVRRPERMASRTHPVHLTHADYGTDPSERAAAVVPGLDTSPKALTAEVAAVHAQLRGTRSSLRQAIILQEVLGPPLALRDGE
jgi:hypothetical protein